MSKPRSTASRQETAAPSGIKVLPTAVAALLIAAGIAYVVFYLTQVYDDQTPKKLADLKSWNWAIGFGLIFLGLAFAARPSTPLGRGRGVVIGMLGTQLDAGVGPGRWEKWRPTVSLGMHEDFLLGRLELLVDARRYAKLAAVVGADLAQASPETQLRVHDTYLADPWDFEGVYAALHDFLSGYDFRTEEEDYYVHITTGTHVSQICWFLLAESRHFPGRLLQTSPPRKQGGGESPTFSASSTLVMRPFSWRVLRILQSMASSCPVTVIGLTIAIKFQQCATDIAFAPGYAQPIVKGLRKPPNELCCAVISQERFCQSGSTFAEGKRSRLYITRSLSERIMVVPR